MILSNFNTFINENKSENNVELYLSNRLIEYLYKIQKNLEKKIDKNKVVNKFIDLIKNQTTGECTGKSPISFIDVTDKDDTVSYIAANKAAKILDKYRSMKKEHDGINVCWLSDRQEQKLHRFINRLFPNEFEHKEIEEFVKEYKAACASDNILDKFEFLKEKDITKYYYVGNYNRENNGELQKSCMRADFCSPWFKIYEDNPDKINMLVLKDPTGKIYGRANIWFLDQPSGKIFMDRIYTTYDWQIKLFVDYAIHNNWIYKSRQVYGGNVIPVIVDGKKEKLIMSVNLKPKKYDYYPYIDTMQFYNPKEGILTSDTKKFEDKDYITLVLANGDYYKAREGYKMDYLGRIVHPYYVRWSKFDNTYVHVNDAIQLDYRGDFVTPEHEFVKIKGTVYLIDDVEKNEEGEYIPKKIF